MKSRFFCCAKGLSYCSRLYRYISPLGHIQSCYQSLNHLSPMRVSHMLQLKEIISLYTDTHAMIESCLFFIRSDYILLYTLHTNRVTYVKKVSLNKTAQKVLCKCWSCIIFSYEQKLHFLLIVLPFQSSVLHRINRTYNITFILSLSVHLFNGLVFGKMKLSNQ